jgi:hypothetical protein
LGRYRGVQSTADAEVRGALQRYRIYRRWYDRGDQRGRSGVRGRQPGRQCLDARTGDGQAFGNDAQSHDSHSFDARIACTSVIGKLSNDTAGVRATRVAGICSTVHPTSRAQTVDFVKFVDDNRNSIAFADVTPVEFTTPAKL